MMGIGYVVRTFVGNKAAKLDPPEIYNWRVFALAAAVSPIFRHMITSLSNYPRVLTGPRTGMLRRYAIWHGHWHHWWCPYSTRLQKVSSAWDQWVRDVAIWLTVGRSEFGISGLSKGDAANLSSNLVVVMQAGAFVGALSALPLADTLGRRPGLMIVSLFAFIGGLLQAFSYGSFVCFYIGRFVEGLGLGGATRLAPVYVAENSPRAIRGLLIGFYQLFETMGAMIAFFIDYGSLLHIPGRASWQVPLAMQSLPPVLILISIFFCPESPRWLARKDNWEKASNVLSGVRHLPVEHPYIQQELLELRTQLEEERRSVHGSGFIAINKECWTIPGNRKRTLMSIGLMVCQQWTGVRISLSPARTIDCDMADLLSYFDRPTRSTTTPPPSSPPSE
jgi:MFS family permease